MDIIQFLHLTGVMHAISQALIVPTVAVLLLLTAYAIYMLTSCSCSPWASCSPSLPTETST